VLSRVLLFLNGVGLLLFLISGIIVFAVDFSNGTIYLPSGKNSMLEDRKRVNTCEIEVKTLPLASRLLDIPALMFSG